MIVVRDLSYLAPSRGAVYDTAVVDTGLWRSGVSYLRFSLCGAASLFLSDEARLGVDDLSGSVG